LVQIIIIIIHQQLDLDRPVSASSHSLFNDLPSHLHPIFSTITLFCTFTMNIK